MTDNNKLFFSGVCFFMNYRGVPLGWHKKLPIFIGRKNSIDWGRWYCRISIYIWSLGNHGHWSWGAIWYAYKLLCQIQTIMSIVYEFLFNSNVYPCFQQFTELCPQYFYLEICNSSRKVGIQTKHQCQTTPVRQQNLFLSFQANRTMSNIDMGN